MSIVLPKPLADDIFAHAVECFPHEACGFVVQRGGGPPEVVRVTNVQNQRHAEDPENFPRTAEVGYQMGPEAVPVLIDHERGRLKIRAIYHSHPEHAAYFSAEDRKQATVWDEPSYPDAVQIVVSVIAGKVMDAKAFRWDNVQRDFVEVELRVGSAP